MYKDVKMWNPEHIEVHDKAQNLYGYKNDRREQTANVIIRRKHINSSSNDIGFALNKEGRYGAIISEYDNQSGFTQGWLTKLFTYYNVEKTKMELESRKIAYVEDKDDQGRMRLRAKFTADANKPKIGVRI